MEQATDEAVAAATGVSVLATAGRLGTGTTGGGGGNGIFGGGRLSAFEFYKSSMQFREKIVYSRFFLTLSAVGRSGVDSVRCNSPPPKVRRPIC